MTERVEACVLEFVQEEGGTYQKCATHGAYVGGECLGRVAALEAALAQAERDSLCHHCGTHNARLHCQHCGRHLAFPNRPSYDDQALTLAQTERERDRLGGERDELREELCQARAEVERLKAEHAQFAFDAGAAAGGALKTARQRAAQADADLARVRAALEKAHGMMAGAMWKDGQIHVCDDSCFIRAALEGRPR